MPIVTPDLLKETLQLSTGALGIGAGAGFALWLTGWMRRRFWVALGITAGFGLYGLYAGRMAGAHPLVAGLLVALAAGFLANELSRLAAFVTGGLVSAVMMQAFVPTLADPLLVYLIGGLASVWLFRLWYLTVSSFAGAVVFTYCALAIAARFFKVNTIEIVTQKAMIVDCVLAGATMLGWVAQIRFEQYVATSGQRKKAKALAALSDEERMHLKRMSAPPPQAKPRFWGLIQSKRK